MAAHPCKLSLVAKGVAGWKEREMSESAVIIPGLYRRSLSPVAL